MLWVASIWFAYTVCLWQRVFRGPSSYSTLRHNKLRDFIANALCSSVCVCESVCVCVCVCVCMCVCVELLILQTLSGETLTFSTTIAEDGACLDVSADGFWGGRHQETYFYARVFNLTAPPYRTTFVPSLYWWFEKEKCSKYEQRIKKVELSSLYP